MTHAALEDRVALWHLGSDRLGQSYQGLHYGVTPADITRFGLAVAAILVIGLLASYLPARCATKVDPARSPSERDRLRARPHSSIPPPSSTISPVLGPDQDKVFESKPGFGASKPVYETAGFNNPVDWTLKRVVSPLEPADAFNIPVPKRGTEGGNENVDCDCS